jgi:hypothetical protein
VNPYNPHPNILAVLRSCITATARPAFPPPKMRIRRFARTILATARPQLTETRADLGALASTTASAEVDDPMIVARIARSWTGAPLFAGRAKNRPADSQPGSGLHAGDRSTDGAVKDLTTLPPHSALGRPVRPPVPPEFAAISGEALHRGLSGHIAVLGARPGR